jgi:hypothetical protein
LLFYAACGKVHSRRSIFKQTGTLNMSISITERIHRRESHDDAETSFGMAKSALKNLVAPPASLEIDTLDNIPLKAVTELSRIHDPFKQLAQAARLHDMLPDEEVTATIDPLIDSSSSELVDTLAEEDRRRRLPSNDPERIPGADYGVYLRPTEVVASFEAHDAHHSPQTEKLVDFAISHASSKDLREMFGDAKKLATEKGIHIMDALRIIRAQPSAFEPNAVMDGYDWLYDKKTS